MGENLGYLLVPIALAALVVSAKHWRGATAAVMVLLIFEGALRKWVLPEAQTAIYLAKDIVLLGAYFGFIAAKGVATPVPEASPVLALVGMAAVYGALEIMNPALPSVTLGFVGWKSYFFYVPLVFLVPHLFSSSEQMLRILRRYALLGLPIAALGGMQFYSPADSAINTYVQHQGDATATVLFGEDFNRARVAGTFAFISGYTAYLTVLALFIVGLLAGVRWQAKGNVALYFTLGAALVAMFTTGSRAPVYSLLLAAPVYLLFSAKTGDLSVGSALKAAIGVMALLASISFLAPEPLDAFVLRADQSEDTESRFLDTIVEPFQILDQVGVAGFGIGAAHQSASYLVGDGFSWWTNGLVVEAETSRVMLELGPLGFILVFLFRILLALSALRAALALKLRAHRALALVIGLYLVLQALGSVIFNPTADIYYWFAAGLLFALYRLERGVTTGSNEVARVLVYGHGREPGVTEARKRKLQA